MQPERYRKQLEHGIDFIASGTEPFWSLEIDFDKTMHFITPNGPDITTPAAKGVKAMDAPVIRFAAETEKSNLVVQLMKQECANSMSGERSAYRVSVNIRSKADKASKIYEGCGQYLFDYRLNDIWILESINNKKLTATGFTKGLPLLEINIAQQKLFGHTGCNTVTGSLEVQGKRLHFGYLVCSRIACPNTGFENTYLNSLSLRTRPYFIALGKLHLQVGTDSTFTYRKTD